MKKTRFLALLVSALTLLVSCETDFDINSKWKDITVVYGLLDQTETSHYIKINKAFLGDGNALQYATVEDSSSYGGNLEVKLVETINDINTREISFDTTSVYNKEPGLFYYPHQVLYRSDELLNQAATYNLKITNKITNKVISATTRLIGDFDIAKPRFTGEYFEFKRSILAEQNFEWTSAPNGRRYQVTVKFYFKESSAPGDTVHRLVDWILPSNKSMGTDGGKDLSVSYLNEEFFVNCKNLIPYTDAGKEAGVNSREVERVDFVFVVLGDEINTYMEVSEPSSGVLQDKPEYTNIVNGIGIFSCRYSKHRVKKLSPITELDLIAMNIKFVKNPDN